jgi:hypothetical protein
MEPVVLRLDFKTGFGLFQNISDKISLPRLLARA